MNTSELFIEKQLPNILSKDETYKLFELVNQGSSEAREKLILCNIRLVVHEVINKFISNNYDKNELISIGIIALIKAVDTFDINKGFSFTTYATKCINNEIKMFLIKNKNDYKIESLNEIIYIDSHGDELALKDIIKDDTDLIENYEQKELYETIRKIIDDFNDRDRDIIKSYFGFYNSKKYTQCEIAEKYKVSRQVIAKKIKNLLKEISKELRKRKFIESVTNKENEYVHRKTIY